MHRLRRHLSYANVVATLALIVAVAGGTTAIAVSKAKKKGAVVRVTRKSDISKKGKIRPGHVTAAKLAGIDVVQRRFALSLPTNVAACPAGEMLLAGGIEIHSSSPPGAAIDHSHPVGNGWLGASNFSETDQTVYALCLRATP